MARPNLSRNLPCVCGASPTGSSTAVFPSSMIVEDKDIVVAICFISILNRIDAKARKANQVCKNSSIATPAQDHVSSTSHSEPLVAEELVASTLQPHTHNAEHQRERKHERIPINHRLRPARRQRPVLPAPQRNQRPDNQSLKAEHQKELGATPALIQLFHLVRCQVAFFDGKQRVCHCVSILRVSLVRRTTDKISRSLCIKSQPAPAMIDSDRNCHPERSHSQLHRERFSRRACPELVEGTCGWLEEPVLSHTVWPLQSHAIL